MAKVKPQKNKPGAIAPRSETIAAADRLHSAAIHLLRRVRHQDAASGVGPAQLEITRDPYDARRMHIRATAKGTRLLQQGRQRRIDYLAAHLGHLTSGELAQLGIVANILERLLRNWR